MTFTDALKEAWQLVKLDRPAFARVAGNADTFSWAIVIAAIAGVAGGLNADTVGLGGFLWLPLVSVATMFVVAGIIHLLAAVLGGRGDYMGLLRIYGLSSIVGWAQMIPVVGFLVALWRVPVLFIALQEHYKLDTGKAVVVLLLPLAVIMFLGFSIMGAFLAALFLA